MKLLRKTTFLICLLVVLVQLFLGTRKFLTHPQGTIVYSKQADMPVITLCHNDKLLSHNLDQFNLSYHHYVYFGEFSDGISTVEEIYEKATNHFYHLLDKSGIKKDFKISCNNLVICM